ncbi:GDSL-type esterase/lipase family protein [Nocardia thailandica]|uniref:GDSL-type esterase/lipase family protein n=1 Tax=Nocardia thailandica TaxID=257275 RepID=UPI0003145EAA|nr:GDSL-type esterase/lipase family protein [Nocardia thailandica]
MSQWIAGFRSAVISPYEEIKLAESLSFTDQTVRQILRLAGGGGRIRLALTNRYGTAPLSVGAAGIALRKTGSAQASDTARPVLVGGAAEFLIAAGESVVTDPIDLPVATGDDLLLSLYLPGPTGLATFSHQPGEISYVTEGDAVDAPELPGAQEVPFRFYVTGVDVLDEAGTPVAVALGDSWFEGVGTTMSANRRSVDALNARLSRGHVVNQGIAGNRLTRTEIGEAGVDRLHDDALSVPGATDVLINFGINDLILGAMAGQAPATSDDLVTAFTALAARAHAAGLRVHAATIGPYAGCVFPGMPIAETLPTRRSVNEWLRTTDLFDSVFDVARAVEDPARPDYIRPDFDSGDGMHLNDAGAAAMAAAVDIDALFIE